jgi:hypothetical protein
LPFTPFIPGGRKDPAIYWHALLRACASIPQVPHLLPNTHQAGKKYRGLIHVEAREINMSDTFLSSYP